MACWVCIGKKIEKMALSMKPAAAKKDIILKRENLTTPDKL